MASDDDHRTTVTVPADTWALLQRELADEQARRIVPRSMSATAYLVLLAERQLLCQRTGTAPRTPPRRLKRR